MKRVLCTVLVVALGATVFVNCKKDGVYNPKKKISKIYVAHLGVKKLDYGWTWEDNLLKKVERFGMDTVVTSKAYYFYDKKQLVRIEYTNDDLRYVEITYNGSSYDRVDFYTKKGAKTSSYVFSYDKKKVSKIEHTKYATPIPASKSMENELLSVFIPKIILEEMDRQIEQNPLLKSADNKDVVYVHTMKYKGDNLDEWEILSSSNSRTSIFKYESYDDKINPMYGSNPIMADGEASSVFHKNNPTKITYESMDSNKVSLATSAITYSYLYDKKYPTEIIKTSTPSVGNPFSDTTYYEYK